MKKAIANKLKRDIQNMCRVDGIVYSSKFYRRAKKWYLNLDGEGREKART